MAPRQSNPKPETNSDQEMLVRQIKDLVENERYGPALDELISLLDQDPDRPEAYAMLEELIDELGRRIERSPDEMEHYTARAQLFEELEYYEDSLMDWNYALRLDKDNPILLCGRGRLRRKAGMLPQAIEDLTRAIVLQPGVSDYHYERSVSRIWNHEIEAGLEDLDTAIGLAPQKAELYLERGMLASRLTWFLPALEDLDRAVQLGLHNAQTLQERGRVHLQLGNAAAAVEDFRQALEQEQDSYTSYLLGVALAESESFEEAVPLLRLAHDEEPSTGSAIDLGYALACSGETAEGLNLIRQAIREDPYAPVGYYRLGRALARLGETEEARETLEHFVGMVDESPERSVAEELLQNLS